MLGERIAEWREAVAEAGCELAAVDLARRRQPGAKQTVSEDEAGLELDLAQQDLAALEEARQLLQAIAAKLDKPDRAALGLAARLLYDVDPAGSTRGQQVRPMTQKQREENRDRWQVFYRQLHVAAP
jgi:hypothetical protein